MPITVYCACGQSFAVRDEYAGRAGKCPECGKTLTVPTGSRTAEVVEAVRRRWPDKTVDLCAVKVHAEAEAAAILEALVAAAQWLGGPADKELLVLHGTGRERGTPFAFVGVLATHARKVIVPWFCHCALDLQRVRDHSLILALDHAVEDMLRADGGAMQVVIADFRWVERDKGSGSRFPQIQQMAKPAEGPVGGIKAMLDSQVRLPGASGSSAGMALEPLQRPLGGWAGKPAAGQVKEADQEAAAVHQLRQAGSVAEVLPLLQSANAEVRSAAVEKLGTLRQPEAVDPLTQALADASAQVRRHAVEALGELADPKTVDALAARLDDDHEDPKVREEAVWALAKIRQPQAMRRIAPTLARWAKENSYRTAPSVEALAAMQDAHIAELLVRQLPQDCEPDSGTWRALRGIGAPHIIAPLIHALAHRDFPSRTLVVELLGESKDPRAVEPLMALMKEDDKYIRRAVIEALGRIGDIRAAPAFQEAAHDKSKTVRKAAFEALQAMGITWI